MGIKFKGFVIQRVYCAGSDFHVTDDGQIKPRRPSKEDIDYYEILDPMEGMKRWIAEDTLENCKVTINRFLFDVGMKSNVPREWAKLD